MLIDTDEYLSMVSRYIHLNPIRVKELKRKPVKEKIEYLKNYKWSSFPGYTNKKKMESFIDYEPVLLEHGGLNAQGHKDYQRLIYSNTINGLEINNRIVEQSLLGSESFVEWIKEKVGKKEPDRECPPLLKLQKYKEEVAIIKVVEKETGKSLEMIKKEKGLIRQITMDLLYRLGGIKSKAIGDIFGLDYSTVSQERKRLRDKICKEPKIKDILNNIEASLSLIKN